LSNDVKIYNNFYVFREPNVHVKQICMVCWFWRSEIQIFFSWYQWWGVADGY